MNNELITNQFEGNNVEIILIDNEPMFEIYSTGAALGYTKKDIKNKKVYFRIRKDRIDKVLENAEITTFAHDGRNYISESQLYDFMLEARTDKCKAFRKWVCEEVLPSIRKNGGYISENATEEQVEKLVENFTFKRIKQIINETPILELEDKIAEIYDTNLNIKFADRESTYKKLNKTDYKIKLKEEIRKDILDRPQANNPADTIVETAIRFRILEKVDAEILTTTRRSASNKISVLQKKIEQLPAVIETNLSPNLEDFVTVNVHGFSNNKMYGLGNYGRLVKTKEYLNWLDNFPREQLLTKEHWTNVDFTKPIRLYINFTVASKNYDVNNLCKSFIDMLMYRTYFVDDNIVEETICKKEGICQYHNQGKIKFYIENI